MKKIWIAIAAAAVIVIGLGIAGFTVMNSTKPERTLERFEDALKQEDADQLKSLIKTDEKDLAVNEKTVSALINYLKKNNSSYSAIKDSLRDQIKNDDFSATAQQISLVEDEKKWGLFPTYMLNVKPVHVKVTGQEKDSNLTISMKELAKPLKEKEENLYGPVLPGVYNIRADVKNDLGSFSKEEKKELWGNTDVSFMVDDMELVKNDKKVQQDIMAAIDLFNSDLAVYQTSGYDSKKLTNVTEAIKVGSSAMQGEFAQVKDYIEEIQSQYLGAVVNLDELTIMNFDNKWTAKAEALVDFNNKVKYKDIPEYEDGSYQSISSYDLVYDTGRKKWLINAQKDRLAMEFDTSSWKNKKEMKVKNPPVRKWTQADGGAVF